MHVEIGREIAFDLTQKAQEFAPAMARIAAPDDLVGRPALSAANRLRVPWRV
jgi:hypothetical protein